VVDWGVVCLLAAYFGPNSLLVQAMGMVWYGILEFNVPLDTL